MRRRSSGTITHVNKRIPAKSNAPTNQVWRARPPADCGSSATRAGARTVAGVATVTAPDSTAGADWATGGGCAAAGVSTVGAVVTIRGAGTSSGLAGVPAAVDSFDAITEGGWTGTTTGSLGREVVASIPVIGCAAGADEATAFSRCFVVTAAKPGIGLGSIAGTVSFCVDIAAAASLAGRTDATTAGCSHARS